MRTFLRVTSGTLGTLTLCGTLGLGGPAQAQVSAVLVGRIRRAESDAPIGDALVVVTSPSLQGEQSVMTQSDGYFRLPSLPAGIYSVQVFHGAYQVAWRQAILRSGQNTLLSVDMVRRRTTENTIDIAVAMPPIDVTSSSLMTTMGAEFLARVPLAAPRGVGGLQRSFQAAGIVVPGALVDVYGISMGGASSPENSYRVHGLNVGSPVDGTLGSPLSLDFVDEVYAVDAGYLPEFGRTAGGTIGAEVSSGSNTWHGGAWSDLATGPRDYVTYNEAHSISTSRQEGRASVNGEIGGPLIFNRLWSFSGIKIAGQSDRIQRHFVAWSRNDQSKLDFRENRHFTESTIEASSVNKLTLRIDDDQKLDLLAMYFPSFDGVGSHLSLWREYNGDEAQRGVIKRGHIGDVALTWAFTRFNKRLTIDTQVAWHGEHRERRPRSPAMPGYLTESKQAPHVTWSADGTRTLFELADASIGLPHDALQRLTRLCSGIADRRSIDKNQYHCPVTNYVTGGIGDLYRANANRMTLRHVVGLSFRAFGHHTAKAGIEVEWLQADRIKQKTGGAMYKEFADHWQQEENIAYVDQTLNIRPVSRFKASTHSLIWGGFVQDQWTIADQLTLNGGLRYDGQVVWVPGTTWLSLPVQLAPRIGMAWDPSKRGKLKIFANYARTYQALPLELALTNGSGESKANHWAWKNGQELCQPGDDIDKCLQPHWGFDSFLPVDRVQRMSTTPSPVDPKLRPTASDEFMQGVALTFGPYLTASVAGRFKSLKRVIEDISVRGGGTYTLANPGYDLADWQPRATRNYASLLVNLDGKIGDYVQANGSYVVAFNHGNYEGFIAHDEILPSHAVWFDDRLVTRNSQGRLPNDHRHQFKLFAGGQWPISTKLTLEAGLSFQARSGAPISARGTHRDFGEHEIFLARRGSMGELKWISNLDLSAGLRWGEANGQSWALRLEVFNVYNAHTTTAVDELYSTDSSIYPKSNGEDVTLRHGLYPRMGYKDPVAVQMPISGRLELRYAF